MALAGAAGGAAQSLRSLLEQRRLAELMAQQEQQRAVENQRADRLFGFQQSQFEADEADRKADREYRGRQETRQTSLDEESRGDRARTRSEQANQRGMRQMIAEGLRLRTTTPDQASVMAFGEGLDVDPTALDPDRPHRQRIDLTNLQHRNELQQIGARGAEDRATAGVRVAGTRDATTQRRIDSKAKGFDSQPAVKRAQMLAETANFAKSLDVKTANPADDQALIYNFAKSMDPDSAVREGEYATIQKYAQSLAQRYGFNAARVFSNSPFLTPEARQNLKDTILSRYQASRGQYDNLRKAYLDQIAQMGGDESDLVDYGAGFPQIEQAAASTVAMIAPDGRRINVPADQVPEAERRGAKRVP